MENIAIIFAGGSGVRMGAGVPKQFLEINGKPILIHTLQLFQEHEEIDCIYLAVNEEYICYTQQLLKRLPDRQGVGDCTGRRDRAGLHLQCAEEGGSGAFRRQCRADP